MISEDITLDKLIGDIDQQIEILTAIAQDSPILVEQLRLLNESRDLLLSQAIEISRLSELIDDELLEERLSIIDQHHEDGM